MEKFVTRKSINGQIILNEIDISKDCQIVMGQKKQGRLKILATGEAFNMLEKISLKGAGVIEYITGKYIVSQNVTDRLLVTSFDIEIISKTELIADLKIINNG